MDAVVVNPAPVAQAAEPGLKLRRQAPVGMGPGHRCADAGGNAHGGHRRRGRTALMVVGRPADHEGGAERREDARHRSRDQSHEAKRSGKRSRINPDGHVFKDSVGSHHGAGILSS